MKDVLQPSGNRAGFAFIPSFLINLSGIPESCTWHQQPVDKSWRRCYREGVHT